LLLIRFAFDFLSPYAYLAWQALPAIAERHGRTLQPMPVVFAALLGANGQKGPAEIPSKRIYVFKDATRTAHVLGVPLVPPPLHPFNPILALRACGLPMLDTQRNALVSALFDACWGGARRDLADPSVVADVASSIGLDGTARVTEASTEAAKARLRAQTDEALKLGAFGVPTMFVDGEMFWGYDSLGHLERRLGGIDPVDQLDLSVWSGLPAGATRRVK